MFRRHLIASAAIHTLGFFALIWIMNGASVLQPKRAFEVVLSENGSSAAAVSNQHSRRGHPRESKQNSKPDLRPAFVKDGIFTNISDPKSKTSLTSRNGDSLPEGFGKEMLLTESKVTQVFDLLAFRVNKFLNYPAILAENGIEGTSTLEIFFNHLGEIDEARSKCFGSHRVVRGMLTQATRKGLVEWFSTDANRLSKEQFKNQHFRADFEVSNFLAEKSVVTKAAPGSYEFTRRRFANHCLSHGGLDLVCATVKLSGAIKNLTSGAYKGRFYALTDHLEHYDSVGLAGINVQVRSIRN
ncbi:MAG TPA: hypothetical protein DCS07_18180 [Bdellovibrionales bacterium]|nr:MAG: hypothetical protein A2Z97_01905 [Bdellovibrionales bacterium GWB1_52_6]OFZ04901.1 MAG: hypothetical protein A2X97_16170 [Bdellovibrionales bacterium GWA1_52_35]OFZ40436.1 MAG: hypothetical protein A2070_02220 [Bdellovibrionales bacterium GWC1_52_8]HAR44531.1 hypothetical protein [Bdellovibrionales bacterium]HCM38833.1 hypothetical protein [Bdellovibrionales bacterium]